MTDPTNSSPAAPAPAVSSAAPAALSPAVSATPATPVSAPVAPAIDTAPVVTPVVSSAPAAETPKTDAPAVEAPKSDTSVLGAEPPKAAEQPKTPESKPGETPEVKAPEGDKKDTAPVEPAALPTYEPFAFPEGVQADTEAVTAFTKVLGGFQNVTKADQAEVQKFGQELVNMQVARETALVDRIQNANMEFFNKQKNDWKTAFENDPEIGGNRMETTALAARLAVREGVTRSADEAVAEQQTNELLKLFDDTGIGNHPALIRTFANLHETIKGLRDKYEKEDSQPLAGKPAAEKKSTYEKFYGKSST